MDFICQGIYAMIFAEMEGYLNYHAMMEILLTEMDALPLAQFKKIINVTQLILLPHLFVNMLAEMLRYRWLILKKAKMLTEESLLFQFLLHFPLFRRWIWQITLISIVRMLLTRWQAGPIPMDKSLLKLITKLTWKTDKRLFNSLSIRHLYCSCQSHLTSSWYRKEIGLLFQKVRQIQVL